MARSTTSPPADDARPGLDLSEVESAMGLWLRLGQQKDLKAFNRRFAERGINQLAYAVLLVLDANPGCRQADLGAALRIRQPNLVEPLDALADRRLIERAPDPRDRRAQTLSLTDDGRAMLADLRDGHEALIAAYRARLGGADYDRLIALLRRFVDGGGD